MISLEEVMDSKAKLILNIFLTAFLNLNLNLQKMLNILKAN